MKDVLHAAGSLAALALTLFWAAATAGRLLFAAVERWLPGRRTFGLLPWGIALAFVATALVPASKPELGAAAFGLAGLGCSALLPLTISLGRAAASPGDLIACYQLGYGLAAFGVAPLHDRVGLSLRVLLGGGAVIALALAGLSIAISRSTSNQKGPRRVAIPNRIVSPRPTTTHAT
jgi:predicted MFS family arabinose efflux permease